MRIATRILPGSANFARRLLDDRAGASPRLLLMDGGSTAR